MLVTALVLGIISGTLFTLVLCGITIIILAMAELAEKVDELDADFSALDEELNEAYDHFCSLDTPDVK